MQVENNIFFFREADKQLFCRERGGSYGKLTPLMIDNEMQYKKTDQNCMFIDLRRLA